MAARSLGTSSAIHWFRKGLRLHDNPALIEACEFANGNVYPVFVLDPTIMKPDKYGVNRFSFLLQSLEDLDTNLRRLGSRLYVFRGDPVELITDALQRWNVKKITFERDPDPYFRELDKKILNAARSGGVKISIHSSNTIHDPDRYLAHCGGNFPSKYALFTKLFDSLPSPRELFDPPTRDNFRNNCQTQEFEMSTNNEKDQWSIPSLHEMGYPELDQPVAFPGVISLFNNYCSILRVFLIRR